MPKKIKILDTFAGAGGFHIALEQSIGKENVECIGFSEIDKFAKQTYLKNFPGSNDLGDITKLDIDNLPYFDLLTGGFPCQDVSVAGKQDLSNGRTVLVEYLLQILEKKQPKYFVFENVKGLMSKKFDTFRESIFDRINACGYNLSYEILNTKDFGLPQNRERVFMIGKRWDYDDTFMDFPKGQNLTTFLKDILEDDVDEKYRMDDIQIAGVNKSNYIGRKPYNIDNKYIGTLLVGGDIKRIISNNGRRFLTPIEYERLQGFPDNWTLHCSNTQRYKQMGNAISVPVVKSIFDNLIKNG